MLLLFVLSYRKAIATEYTKDFFFLKRLDGSQKLIILYLGNDFETCLLSRVFLSYFSIRLVSAAKYVTTRRTGLPS